MGEKKNIKLVISDVDGTIFDRKDTITDGLELLKEYIRDYKVPFSLASGRCYKDLKKLVEYLNLDLPVIVNNGGGIVQHGKVLWEKNLNRESVREAVEFADSCGMFVAIYDSLHEVVYRHNAYVQTYIDRFQKDYTYLLKPDEVLSDEKWSALTIQKILFIDPQKPGRIQAVIDKMNLSGLAVVKYDSRSADVMSEGCDKQSAVERLSSMLKTALNEIAAIGDNENDIKMMKVVGQSCAVANATDSLKQKTAYVCQENGAAGVAEVVQRFYISRKKAEA